MKNSDNRITTTLHIKNMLSRCCLKVIRDEFERNNIAVENIRLGEATISFNKKEMNLENISTILKKLGF
ncbi:MAG: hypothetical protein K8R74_01390, partial [Bacteroidales bacterium]|nr:hypothetical protein [Bacteroidales bacterium]